MERDKIRQAIAMDLKGKAYRDKFRQKRELAQQLEISADELLNQIHQMIDLGHVTRLNDIEIRLSVDGERFYFSGKRAKTAEFLKRNWPHIASNLIALVALGIAIFRN